MKDRTIPLSKKVMAGLIRRMPLSRYLLGTVMMLTRARFTVGVVGVVLNDQGQMLLLEHVYHPRHPWGIPGGWLERGERPEDGVAREILEETGLEIVVVALLCIETSFHGHHLDMAYQCSVRGTISRLSSEILSYEWVSPSAVPQMSEFHHKAVQALIAKLSSPEKIQ